ncbi:putative pyrophosphatase PpaX [Nematostella vectensis]|uniref:putative pyrophosphatase PpaX n=1 Tax=Nematostella vectensis TaxID=45351 RepID=UPI002076F77D|nr:putative pyrophosphatase PpaX [Nematostella vectensis]
MAVNISTRRLFAGSASKLKLLRGINTQADFSGLRAAAVYDSNLGFGYNGKGEIVIVGPQRKGVIVNGHNYGLLFNKPDVSETSTDLLLKPIRDHDLWVEGHTKTRGGTPWYRPVVPRRGPQFAGAATFSSLAGDGYSSKGKDIPTSLVIFDKDGTLINCNSVWIPWFKAHVDEIERSTGMDLADKLYEAVGYCPVKNEYHEDALLAHAVIADIKNKVKEVLVKCGLDSMEAHVLVENCCNDFDTGNEEMLEPLGDLNNIFSTLKSNNVKIAVCTADSRSGTMSALDRLGLTSMVDMVVCGDDEISKPKPAPDNALNICRNLNVCPTKTVVIGDTTADTGMGRSAGLGLTVGVLSGAGSRKSLEKDSDVVVDSVNELLGIIFRP